MLKPIKAGVALRHKTINALFAMGIPNGQEHPRLNEAIVPTSGSELNMDMFDLHDISLHEPKVMSLSLDPLRKSALGIKRPAKAVHNWFITGFLEEERDL
ncbi:Hypothetical predicted protein [Podarcis lilfordi]|uniref:Uncharacterized protein n=1 Tax=Podarcis lilfordi TaxID=74358 RepID=A0AA35P498_9SAUR|nr:Hypothetical predicted protein [Podarcis lilfordi]